MQTAMLRLSVALKAGFRPEQPRVPSGRPDGGRKWGCHRCGSTDPKNPSGSFIGDHQVPKSMGTPTRIYPHCLHCSASQGGLIGNYRRRTFE